MHASRAGMLEIRWYATSAITSVYVSSPAATTVISQLPARSRAALTFTAGPSSAGRPGTFLWKIKLPSSLKVLLVIFFFFLPLIRVTVLEFSRGKGYSEKQAVLI